MVMSKPVENREKTHMEVFKTDKARFKNLADKEKRTMLVMFGLLLDEYTKQLLMDKQRKAEKGKKGKKDVD